MSSTVEVIIKAVTLVLPLQPDSTVASVSEAAIQEYKKFQLRDHPQKVLYTKDAKGRVLSGALLISQTVSETFTVVVQDYSQQDSAAPSEVLKLYREWQLWGAAQLKEHIQYLSYREFPIMPDATVLQLLEELSRAPNNEVQLSCISSYRLLLCKFPQKQVIIVAAEQISKIFAAATAPDVAIAALESFKDLGPLQMKLFDSSHYMRNMIDVQHHLMRFPIEARSRLFRAFENIISIIEDEELLTYLQSRKEIMEKETEVLMITEGADDGSVQQKVEAFIANVPQSVTETPPSQSATKKWNLARLLSLMASEDSKIKHYSLEKLRKVLITACSERKMSKKTRSKTNYARKNDKPISSMGQPHADDSYWVVFKDEDEFQRLILALFQCLKVSIRGRQPAPSSSSQMTEPAVSTPPAFQGLSTAGRLITVALTAKDTDLTAVRICLECLYILYHHSTSIVRILSLSMPQKNRRCHPHEQQFRRGNDKQVNPLTGRPLSRIQRLCASYGREYHRLLFTLSHAGEMLAVSFAASPSDIATMKSIDPFVAEEIAERSAFLFAMVVLHFHPTSAPVLAVDAAGGGGGGRKGWSSSALVPEHVSLCAFLGLREPCYRLYLALTYMLHLAVNSAQLPLSQQQLSGANGPLNPTSARLSKSRRVSAEMRLTKRDEHMRSLDDHEEQTSRHHGRHPLDRTSSTADPTHMRSSRTRELPDHGFIGGNGNGGGGGSSSSNSSSNSNGNGSGRETYTSRLEELLCQEKHALLRVVWWWCIADARQDEAPTTIHGRSSSHHHHYQHHHAPGALSGFASNFLVRRFAWRILAEASICLRVTESLWQTQQPPNQALAASPPGFLPSRLSGLFVSAPTTMLRDTVEIVPFLLTQISRAYRYVPPRTPSSSSSSSSNKLKPHPRSSSSARTRATFISIERANGVCRPTGALTDIEGSEASESSIDSDSNAIAAENNNNSNNNDASDLDDEDGKEDDEESDAYETVWLSEDSYSDQETGGNSGDVIAASDQAGIHPGRRPDALSLHRWSPQHGMQGYRIRVDFYLLRALLKTLSNIFQVSPLSHVYFGTHHRTKLRQYLQWMVIGDDPEKYPPSTSDAEDVEARFQDVGDDHSSASSSSYAFARRQQQHEHKRRVVTLDAVAGQDSVVAVYYHLLLDLLHLPVIDELDRTLTRPV